MEYQNIDENLLSSDGGTKPTISNNKNFNGSFSVLVAEDIDQEAMQELSQYVKVDKIDKLNEENLCNIIGNYDALIVRSKTQVNKNVIEKAKKLKVVARAGVGVDNIDVFSATQHGIFVLNSPTGNTVAAAEHTLGLMLALSRNIPQANSSMKSSRWEKSKFMGTQLQNKTLGIIGLGQVGSHVARVAKEMGMHLMCYDPFVNTQKAESLSCVKCTIDELLSKSDYVTIHIPLTDETTNLINKKAIMKMKPTARIINCSRGGIICEDDLVEALLENRLAGAALDVLEIETAIPSDSKLLLPSNLILTPHLGASTHEALKFVSDEIVQQIIDILPNGIPKNAINIPGIKGSEVQRMLPIMKCCETLGRFAAHMLRSPVVKIIVNIEGAYALEDENPFLISTAKGVLGLHNKRKVNILNARILADNFKINLASFKDNHNGKSCIKVTIMGANELVSVQGILIEDGLLMLTGMDDIPVYLLLPDIDKDNKTYMFYSKHEDIPGIIAKATTVLSNNGINVANCHLGRKEINEKVIGVCIYHTDSKISESILSEIRNCPGIIDCNICFSPQSF